MSPAAAAARVLALRRAPLQPAERRLGRLTRGWLVRRSLLLGGLLVALCVLRVWLSHQVMRVAYDLSEARKVQLKLEHEQRELELELATLRDPRRIEEAARHRLGMTEPGRGQVVLLP